MHRTAGVGRRDFLKVGTGSMAGLVAPASAVSQGAVQSTTYRRMAEYLQSIRAIDCHDHLRPFDALWGYVETGAAAA